jgi:hypothetical protein
LNFETVNEIQEKFLIRVIGDTNPSILLDVFNGKFEESVVIELLDNETNPRPYDILNLARYYKYILNKSDKYMEYVMKAKEL